MGGEIGWRDRGRERLRDQEAEGPKDGRGGLATEAFAGREISLSSSHSVATVLQQQMSRDDDGPARHWLNARAKQEEDGHPVTKPLRGISPGHPRQWPSALFNFIFMGEKARPRHSSAVPLLRVSHQRPIDARGRLGERGKELRRAPEDKTSPFIGGPFNLLARREGSPSQILVALSRLSRNPKRELIGGPESA
ncbi:hypothetical protein LX36DRAFT_317970 [Colletotrichum falcatum]|nr:hypothetical protein LX36DRAFT_317970 [Colletotrichum falcatum]